MKLGKETANNVVKVEKDILGNLYIVDGDVTGGMYEALKEYYLAFGSWYETIPDIKPGLYKVSIIEHWNYEYSECDIEFKFTHYNERKPMKLEEGKHKMEDEPTYYYQWEHLNTKALQLELLHKGWVKIESSKRTWGEK